jgi:hypothetical protein
MSAERERREWRVLQYQPGLAGIVGVGNASRKAPKTHTQMN